MTESAAFAESNAKFIFDLHFQPLLDIVMFERAQIIFATVGAYNSRSIAIQFHTAHQVGKLDGVLVTYERIINPDSGYWHLIPDDTTRAVEMRQFADVVYSSVIAKGNPARLFAIASQNKLPEIFDQMDAPFA